jgi:hypothetical protein
MSLVPINFYATAPVRYSPWKKEVLPSSVSFKKWIRDFADEYYKNRLRTIFLFSLNPVFTLKIDLHKLVERNLLAPYVKSNQGELLAKSLLYSANSSSSHVYVKVYPNTNGNMYELIDTQAEDLKKCHYVFGRIFGHSASQAVLYQFSAPSFSGKKAMTLIWNIMAITGIQNMLFTDVSTMLSCCEQGALTSLHLVEVITKGKSWYCTQGATPQIIPERFQKVFYVEFIENAYRKFLAGDLKDKRITHAKNYPKNFEIFSAEYLKYYLEGHTDEDAYLLAANFLHSIKSRELRAAFAELSPVYPQLTEAQNLLDASPNLSASKISEELHELLQRGLSDQGQIHQRMHDMRDCLVSNKNSVFFQYIIDKLQKINGVADSVGIALAFLILDNFYKKLKGLKDPSLKSYFEHPEPDRLAEMIKESHAKLQVSQVLYNILTPDEHAQENVKCMTQKLCSAFLRMIENRPSSPVSAKICNNSHKASREKWVNYSEATGTVDDLVACQSAVSYLASLPLVGPNSIKAEYPQLIELWEKRYSFVKVDAWRLTIADLIDALRFDGQGVDALFDDLFRGAIKHISTLSIKMFTSYEKKVEKDPKHAYELFMIAKYLIRRKEYFALYL